MQLIEAEKLIEKAYWHGDTPSFGELYPEGHDAVDVEDIENAPTIDAVPINRLKDLCKRWTSVCAMCIYEECDKCALKVCIDELKEIIDSSEREDGDFDDNC